MFMVFPEEFSHFVAYRGHSCLTFTKNQKGKGAGGTEFWPLLPKDFEERVFSYSCERPQVRLVNLFLSVIRKFFLHLLGFLVLHCFLEAIV